MLLLHAHRGVSLEAAVLCEFSGFHGNLNLLYTCIIEFHMMSCQRLLNLTQQAVFTNWMQKETSMVVCVE